LKLLQIRKGPDAWVCTSWISSRKVDFNSSSTRPYTDENIQATDGEEVGAMETMTENERQVRSVTTQTSHDQATMILLEAPTEGKHT
jgi:hypothetical protein